MSHTVVYKKGLNYDINIVKWILQMIGAWPIPISSPISIRIVYRLQNFVIHLLFLVTIVPPLLHTFMKEKSRRIKLKLLGPIFNSSLQFTKYLILLHRAEDIRKSISMINQDWMNAGEWDRQIYRSKTQVGRKLVLTSVIFMFGGGLCYRTILPLLRGKTVTSGNVTTRPLPCPSYFILFNEQVTPFYEIIFSLQFFAGVASYSVTSGACGISAFFVLHTCSQLNILAIKMRQLTEGIDGEETVQKRLVDIINHQTTTKQFLKHIQGIIEYISFFEVFGSGLLMCVVGFYVIMEWENSNAIGLLTYSMLLMSFIFCVFIYCYIGQLLINESDAVGKTSITINWYRLPIKKAYCLVLIIAMSNYPTKLVAGKMLAMSLDTFLDIMKMSAGYLNILRKMI